MAGAAPVPPRSVDWPPLRTAAGSGSAWAESRSPPVQPPPTSTATIADRGGEQRLAPERDAAASGEPAWAVDGPPSRSAGYTSGATIRPRTFSVRIQYPRGIQIADLGVY